jgi:hypothetical protein
MYPESEPLPIGRWWRDGCTLEGLYSILLLEDILREVNPKASPGVPWNKFAKTNQDIIKGACLMDVLEEVRRRLQQLCCAQIRDMNRVTPQYLVDTGLCDPIRLFVKNEPHALKKIQEGRFRLISSVSIVDQIVERILFSRQNTKEIANWGSIPSQPGMGHNEDQVQATCESVNMSVMVTGCYPRSSDMEGWDFSVTEEDLIADWQVRKALTTTSDPIWERASFVRTLCLSRAVFCFSDGMLVAQTPGWYGLMKSGSYLTSSTNSRVRVMHALWAGAESAIAMGDDCVEHHRDFDSKRIESHYQKVGKKLKSFVEWEGVKDKVLLGRFDDRPDATAAESAIAERVLRRLGYTFPGSSGEFLFEFCSHAYLRLGDGRYAAVYLGWQKSLMNLVRQQEDKTNHLAEFVELMSRNMWAPYCMVALHRSGWLRDVELDLSDVPHSSTPHLLVRPHDAAWRAVCDDGSAGSDSE